MVQDRGTDIERGMALVARLPEVMPDQAGGHLRRVYEETRQTLRVPFVNFIFRVLANYEDYLVPEWDRLRPWARTLRFERAADTIRDAALLDPAPAFPKADWSALGDLGRIRLFTDSIHYVLPKLLLLATTMDERLGEQRPGAVGQAYAPAPGSDGELPWGVAAGTLAIPMVSPERADPVLRALFDRIKERHAHPGVATYYRSLGHWPAFLQAVWERIEPLVGIPAYDARRQVLIERALASVTAMSPPEQGCGPLGMDRRPLPAGVVDDLRAGLAVFRFRIIPDILIDVALVRAMLDGPGAARRSRFSAAQPANGGSVAVASRLRTAGGGDDPLGHGQQVRADDVGPGQGGDG